MEVEGQYSCIAEGDYGTFKWNTDSIRGPSLYILLGKSSCLNFVTVKFLVI
jgi:hypothetical protein